MSLVTFYLTLAYGIILLLFFLVTRGSLRKVVISGDERQKFLFYRASYDGLIAGFFGYIVVRGLDMIMHSYSLPSVYFVWVPSPIVVAYVTLYISYRIRIKKG